MVRMFSDGIRVDLVLTNIHRISLTYGHPFMIDVQDCDARLPSSGDPHDRYMDELVRLSVVLGRVQKAIYTCVLAVHPGMSFGTLHLTFMPSAVLPV